MYCSQPVGDGRGVSPCWNAASTILSADGQAVIARIDLTLDDDATAIAHAKQLIVGEAINVDKADGARAVHDQDASPQSQNRPRARQRFANNKRSSFERSAYFPTTPRFPGRAILDIDTTFDVNYATVSRLLPSGTWWNPNWSSCRHIFLVSCDSKSGRGTPHDKSCAECAPLWRA